MGFLLRTRPIHTIAFAPATHTMPSEKESWGSRLVLGLTTFAWIAKILLLLAFASSWMVTVIQIPLHVALPTTMLLTMLAFQLGQAAGPAARAPPSAPQLPFDSRNPQWHALHAAIEAGQRRANGLEKKAFYACRVIVGLLAQTPSWPATDPLREHFGREMDTARAWRLSKALGDVLNDLAIKPLGPPKMPRFFLSAEEFERQNRPPSPRQVARATYRRRRDIAWRLFQELESVFDCGPADYVDFGFTELESDNEAP